MIKESPVSVECRVKEIKELGSHHMFIAEVLAIHADERYINEKGAFDISKCNLIAYSNGGYYTMGKKVGKFGFSVQKNKIKKIAILIVCLMKIINAKEEKLTKKEYKCVDILENKW